jgi:thioredoxin 1
MSKNKYFYKKNNKTKLMKNIILLIISCISVVSSYSQSATKHIGAVEFKSLVEKKDGIILDTRTVPEFNRGHIEGAQLVDLQDPNIGSKLITLPKDKPLYLYCYSGARSRVVANFLENNGYSNIYNLQRGIIDWNNNKFAVVMPEGIKQSPKVDALLPIEYTNLIESEKLLFIDFYAPWCAPCKQMMPMINQLAKEYEGKVKIIKVNSDDSKELMQQLAVRGVPYFQLFKGGEKVYEKYGVVTKEELSKLFDQSITK